MAVGVSLRADVCARGDNDGDWHLEDGPNRGIRSVVAIHVRHVHLALDEGEDDLKHTFKVGERKALAQ